MVGAQLVSLAVTACSDPNQTTAQDLEQGASRLSPFSGAFWNAGPGGTGTRSSPGLQPQPLRPQGQADSIAQGLEGVGSPSWPQPGRPGGCPLQGLPTRSAPPPFWKESQQVLEAEAGVGESGLRGPTPSTHFLPLLRNPRHPSWVLGCFRPYSRRAAQSQPLCPLLSEVGRMVAARRPHPHAHGFNTSSDNRNFAAMIDFEVRSDPGLPGEPPCYHGFSVRRR